MRMGLTPITASPLYTISNFLAGEDLLGQPQELVVHEKGLLLSILNGKRRLQQNHVANIPMLPDQLYKTALYGSKTTL